MSPKRRLDAIEWGFSLLLAALLGLWFLFPPQELGAAGGQGARTEREQGR